MIAELSQLLLKNGHTTVGTRVLELSGKSKKDIISGLEVIISELKTGDLKADGASKQMIKHVYRQLTQ